MIGVPTAFWAGLMRDGSLVCDSPSKLFGIALLNTYFAIMFPICAYAVIASPSNANLIAFLLAVLFSGFALRFFYLSVKAFLVKRTLVAVWDFVGPAKKFAANIPVERDAAPKAARAPHLNVRCHWHERDLLRLIVGSGLFNSMHEVRRLAANWACGSGCR